MSSFASSIGSALMWGSMSLSGLYENMCVMTPGMSQFWQAFDDRLPIYSALEKIVEGTNASEIDAFIQAGEKYRHYDDKKSSARQAELNKIADDEKAKYGKATEQTSKELVDTFITPLKHMLFYMGLERKKFLEGRSTEKDYKDKMVEVYLKVMRDGRYD